MRLIFGGAAALALMVPVAASAMTVADFLSKADALKAKGMMAMLSSDVGLLKAEIQTAAAAYRSDVAAGKPPTSCPPPKGSAKMSSDELIANFRTIPAAQQKATSVRAAFANYMAKRFPCKA
jgi:hypothetical protein